MDIGRIYNLVVITGEGGGGRGTKGSKKGFVVPCPHLVEANHILGRLEENRRECEGNSLLLGVVHPGFQPRTLRMVNAIVR